MTSTGLVVASGTTTPILVKDAHHVRPSVITATGASLPLAQVFSPSLTSAVSGVGPPPYAMSPSVDTVMGELVAPPTPATEVSTVASLFPADPPRIRRITPSSGPISAATEVTIHGGPFLESDVCWFGWFIAETSEILYDGQVMIVKTPVVTEPGPVDVAIARMNGDEEPITSIEPGVPIASYQYVSSASVE